MTSGPRRGLRLNALGKQTSLEMIQRQVFPIVGGAPSPGGDRILVRLRLESNLWREADIDHESDQVEQEHSVDALALRGDEGRGTLR